jgi:hypothetical protein
VNDLLAEIDNWLRGWEVNTNVEDL